MKVVTLSFRKMYKLWMKGHVDKRKRLYDERGLLMKNGKRLTSVFIALTMVLSVGVMPVFAAENTDNASLQVTSVEPRAIVFTETGWNFSSQRDSNTRDLRGPGRFYATAGQTISFAISGVHSGSSQGFDVYLYRANSEGMPYASGVRGPYHVDANISGGHTLSLYTDYTGYHIIRCKRTDDGYKQFIDSVTIAVS